VADLLQRQAEPAGLGDEVQDAQDVSLVHAIPGGRPPRLDTMPRASYRRSALRLTPLRVATSPIVKRCSGMD
jgi:hypothetical protein